jgi:hypothetical protein
MWKALVVVLPMILSSIYLEGLRKPRQTLGRTVSLPAEDEIPDLGDTNQE